MTSPNPSTGELKRLNKEIERLKTRPRPQTLGLHFTPFLDAWRNLPGLTALWLPGNIAANGQIADQSGFGRTLTRNGNPFVDFLSNDLPVMEFDGTGDYWERADEAGLDFTGAETIWPVARRGFSMAGYFRIDNTGAALRMPAGKAGAAGNLSYYLQKQTTDVMRFTVSANGTNEFFAVSAGTVVSGRWYFFAGRFDPSTELKLWMESATTSETAINTTSIPASIFSGNGTLGIGRWTGGAAQDLDGGCAGFAVASCMWTDDEVEALLAATRPFVLDI